MTPDDVLADVDAELVNERFGPIPWRERYARPNPIRPLPWVLRRRRIDLCGTSDLGVSVRTWCA